MKDLNLVPSQILSEQRNKNIKKQFYTVGVLVILVSIAIISWPLVNYFNLVGQKNALAQRNKDMDAAQIEAASINTIKAEIDKKEEVANKVEDLQDIYLDILTNLENKIPKRVSALSLSITDNGKKITFSGAASDNIAVADFLRALREIEGVKDISIGGITEGNSTDPAKEVKAFQIDLKYERRSNGI